MSDSYERGGTPRSVLDPDGEAYDEMIRRHQARQTAQETTNSSASQEQDRSDLTPDRGFFGRHPSFGGSLVPVLGPAREAYADHLDGDEFGATANKALMFLDLTGAEAIGRDILTGGFKVVGSHTWNATRKWMGKQGLLDAGQHGHHGVIPQNGWGKIVPDWIKNQPYNIRPMPSPEIHGRIHGPYAGKPRYNIAERFWRGSPLWAKAAVGEIGSTLAAPFVRSPEDQRP